MNGEPTPPNQIKNTASPVKNLIGAVLIAIVLVAIIGIEGISTKLTCQRVNSGAPVNCAKQTSLLGLIPLDDEEIGEVFGARVGTERVFQSCTFSDPCYRVELLTSHGAIPLTLAYRHGSSSISEANNINDYLRSATDKILVVTEPLPLSTYSPLAVGVVIFFLVLDVAAAWSSWRKIRS